MTISFLVRPGEGFYFGPPSSLAAGDSHHGQSLFPPPPSAWQGIIRTRLLAAAGMDLRDRSRRAREARADLVGGPGALPEGWRIEGPTPAQSTGAGLMGYFPTPRWVLTTKDDRGWDDPPRTLLALPLDRPDGSGEPDLESDLGPSPVPVGAPGSGRTSPLDGWLSATDMRAVLRGGHPAEMGIDTWKDRRLPCWDLPPCADWETRSGVAVNHGSGTVEQGMLYFVKTVRMHDDAGLVGWLHGEPGAPIPADALTSGAQTSGRKARPVFFEEAPELHEDWEAIRDGRYLPSAVEDGRRFWLYLLSPTYLETPAQPTLAVSEEARQAGVRIRVLAALLGKPLWLGGLSLETHRVRANRPCVPAGSAWLIEIEGGHGKDRGDALRDLHNMARLYEKQAQADFGEGITLVGLLPQD